jgi:hypothetical protein
MITTERRERWRDEKEMKRRKRGNELPLEK